MMKTYLRRLPMSSNSEFMHEYWFIFQNDRLLIMKNSNENKLPTNSALSELRSYFLIHHLLGEFNKIICYCAELEPTTLIPDDIEPTPLRKAFEILGMDWYVAAAKAASIIHWDKNHQFCGRCGTGTLHKPGTFERIC